MARIIPALLFVCLAVSARAQTVDDATIADLLAADRAAADATNDGDGLPNSDVGGERHDDQSMALASRFQIQLGGKLRVEAGTFLPDRFLGIRMPSSYLRDSEPQIGRDDGFALGDARLDLRATYGDNLQVRMGFDGALATYANDQSPIGVLNTGLMDAYVRYTVFSGMSVYLGRFKPPFDIEELTPTENQFFVHRSLESRGVLRHEGPHAQMFGASDTGGFAPRRQLGVMVGSDSLFNLGTAHFAYALAMTNGNAGDASLNDNDLPAFWLRLATYWADDEQQRNDDEGPVTYSVPNGGSVGLSAYYNELTTGIAPNRYRDQVAGAGIDFAYSILVFNLQGQVLASMLQPVSRNDTPTVYSLGGHLQLAIQIPETGLYPAYRFAYLDPRYVTNRDELVDLSPDQDKVMHHTVGLNYRAQSMPVVFNIEYTRSVEEDGRAMPNDRIEAAMQVTFQ